MTIVVMDASELESMIRNILREELHSMLGSSADSDLPRVLTVNEAAKVFRVGLDRMYEIVRRDGFPAIREGSRFLIPRDPFLKWVNQSTGPRG